jgi:uncharacterized membrane protein YhaH (DUF805 family)
MNRFSVARRVASAGAEHMADVFISYSREDRPHADQVARGLAALGLEAFWDTEIPPGQTWADYIEGKLSQCKAVVVLWSEHSTKSQWVREEARMGRDKSKLIPAMLDGTPPPFGFGEVQAANLSTWRGEADHPEWVRLSSAVRNVVGVPSGPPAPQAAPQPSYTPPPAPQPQTVYASDASGAVNNSPIGYIQNCFRLYVNGTGRARRAEFGWFVLFYYVLVFAAAFIDVGTSGINPDTSAANDSYAVMWIVGLALLCPFVAVASRRAHDFGQSGWLAILCAVPYVGFIATLAFIFISGQAGANQYGPNPKGL